MRKRNISLLILAAIVTFLMAGCKKDTTTLKARISPFSNESKVYISGTSTPRWETGDLVNVNGTQCAVSVSTTSTIEAPTSNAYQAVYPNDLVATNGNQLGSSTVTLNIPRVQAYETTTNGQVVKAPMGAFVSGSSSLQFTNMGALLAIAVKNDKSDRNNLVIDSIAVQTVGDSPVLLWGTATVNDITSSDRAYEVSSTGLTETEIANHRIISLAKSNEQGNLATLAYNNEPKTFYLYVPSVSGSIDNRYKITIYSHIGGTVYIYEKEQSNAGSGNVGLSQYAAVPYMTSRAHEDVQADTWIAGSIHSLFSDQGNDSRHKVMFAQGNLVWTGSSSYATGEYSFHTSQETTLSSISATNIDVFYPNADPTHITWPYDIGTNIAIKVGDITCQTGAWKTLSQSQWYNILGIAGGGHPRTVNGGQGEGHCFNIVRLGSILGLLLYPDNYTGTTYSTSHPSSLNSYPDISDTGIPEGCVFLPVTGIMASSVYTISDGNKGYYWTSNGEYKAGKDNCFHIYFTIGSTTSASSIIQGRQLSSVTTTPRAAYRLVHDTTLAQ